MKCRELSFFIDPVLLDASMAKVAADVLPKFLGLPHFRGYVTLESDHGSHRQVRVMSFWDDGLDGSDEASQAFIEAVYDIVGTNPVRETFDVRGALLIDDTGMRHVEIP
jgi:hypothetical protein